MDDRLQSDIEDIEKEIRQFIYDMVANREDSPVRRDLDEIIRKNLAAELRPELAGIREDLKQLAAYVKPRDHSEEVQRQIHAAVAPLNAIIHKLTQRLDKLAAESRNAGPGQGQTPTNRFATADPHEPGRGVPWKAIVVMGAAVSALLAVGAVTYVVCHPRMSDTVTVEAPPEPRTSSRTNDDDNNDGRSDNGIHAPQTLSPANTSASDDMPSPAAKHDLQTLGMTTIISGGKNITVAALVEKTCKDKKATCHWPDFPSDKEPFYQGLVVQIAASIIGRQIKCETGIAKLDGEPGRTTQDGLAKLQTCLQNRLESGQAPCETPMCLYPDNITAAIASKRYTALLNWLLPLVATPR